MSIVSKKTAYCGHYGLNSGCSSGVIYGSNKNILKAQLCAIVRESTLTGNQSSWTIDDRHECIDCKDCDLDRCQSCGKLSGYEIDNGNYRKHYTIIGGNVRW